MKVHGIPERFWIVVQPTRSSELGDICFACDFRRFALQVRGGLDADDIVGVFADEQEAVEAAEDLLAGLRGGLQ